MNTQTLDNERSVGTLSDSVPTESWSRDSHPPSPLDRLAMRIGLALVLWSRHEHRTARSREAEWELIARRYRLERERRAREQAWLASASGFPRR